MPSAAITPLGVPLSFVHPFLVSLLLIYFVPLRFSFFIRRKQTNSSHVIVWAAAVRSTQLGYCNLVLSFLFCLLFVSA